MAITALQGLLKTMCTALGQPRLLGRMAHALCTRFTKRLENPQTFLPKSHVGLVLQRVAELSPEFSSSAYLTDTQLSRLKRVPQRSKDEWNGGIAPDDHPDHPTQRPLEAQEGGPARPRGE